jgi:NAD(P)-dependent dehydrogenase (short-subunit alcohol dehydrogenase family)
VNTSSVNGFWASLGPGFPHTAYCSAKFAVKGLSEALITDLRLNAPHIGVSVVMPGHIGTDVVLNSFREHGRDPKSMTSEQIALVRRDLARRGIPTEGASDEDIRLVLQAQGEAFRDFAPTSAAEAATIILDGVRQRRWRILVGDDAEKLDVAVREAPVDAYEPEFFERVRAAGVFSRLALPVDAS